MKISPHPKIEPGLTLMSGRAGPRRMSSAQWATADLAKEDLPRRG
jgi:hypothetical protein